MSRIGAILTTFNGLDMTRLLVASLPQALDLVAVDNLSDDGTRGWLRSVGIDVIQPSARCSVAAALNLGRAHFLASEKTPDYLLVLNNDVTLPPSYIDQMLAFADAAPHAAWVTGYARGWIADEHVPTEPVEMDGEMITGDCVAFLFRSQASLDAGTWDERFSPRYSEDEDMLTRLRLLGWECWRLPIPYDGVIGGYQQDNPGEMDQQASYRHSLRIYLEKWGDCPRSARRFRELAGDIIGDCPCVGYTEESALEYGGSAQEARCS